MCARVAVELAAEEAEGVRHDHVYAVQLGLEVVVESGRADPDRRRYVGELGRLVAVFAEICGSCPQDLVAFAARRHARGIAVPSRSGPRGRGRHEYLLAARMVDAAMIRAATDASRLRDISVRIPKAVLFLRGLPVYA